MRSDLTRSTSDRRTRECGNGKPRCRFAPDSMAPDNPLGLCADHLRAYRAACGIPEAPACPACTPVVITLEDGRVWHPAGAMCFVCDMTTGGTVATETHRRTARRLMIDRIGALLIAGARGSEWTALLARAPEDVRTRALARVAAR